jgi:hypothetical protein
VNGIRIVTSAVADFHVGMSLPFVLQRQLPDLGVQRLQIRPAFALLGGGGEHLGGSLAQLSLPGGDLVGMNLKLLRQLAQRLLASQSRQGHPGH